MTAGLLRGLALVAGAAALFVGGLGVGAWLASGPSEPGLPDRASMARAPVSSPNRADVSRAAVPLPSMSAPQTAEPPTGVVRVGKPGVGSDTLASAAPASSRSGANLSAPPAGGSPSPSAPADSPAWRRHAVAVDVPADVPMIAIVLDDLGIDKRRSARAIALPAPMTLAFLPYADGLDRQTKAARAGGHELLMHMPMQPHGHNSDPGPNVLDIRLGEPAVAERLSWNLARFEGYVGVNNHMGSRFTESEAGMRIVAADLRDRGLMFLDSLTSPRSVALRVAEAHGVPATSRDVFLDNTDSAAEVEMRLAETERVARRTGTAIAIGHPRDATLDVLSVWIEQARSAGFALVPLTAVLERRRAGPRQQASRP